MRLRVKYKKNKDARFLSHLELMKAMERAFRRAKIPMEFSGGFNPHPKISYASALSVGIASEGEYLDVELSAIMSPKDFMDNLNEYQVKGIEIVGVKEITSKVTSLTAVIEKARYVASCFLDTVFTDDELERKIDDFLDEKEILVIRKTKDKVKEVDIRGGIHDLYGEIRGNELILTYTVQSGSSGNVRAGEVLSAFLAFCGIKIVKDAIFTRMDLYGMKGNKLCSPMEM
jgi:radical SAM-linked protein